MQQCNRRSRGQAAGTAKIVDAKALFGDAEEASWVCSTVKLR